MFVGRSKSKTEKEKVRKKIKYKGLTVNHRFNSSENELKEKHTKKYLKKLYNKLRKKYRKGKFFSKTSDLEVDLPSPEVILEASKVVLPNYPYEEITGYNNINFISSEESRVDMIQSDFDGFAESDIESHNEIIDEYYSMNLDYEVLDEIASKPEIYYSIGDVTLQKNGEFGKYLCNMALFSLPYGLVRGSIAYTLAGSRAKKSSSNYYPNLDAGDTRRDAYRHILWNSLLAQYYFTISSKVKRLNFAKFIADNNERLPCGGSNADDGKQMDYHNNVIGRQIWDQNTSYRKFLGWVVGLRKPSTSDLKDFAHAKVEKQSCLIVKKDPNDYLFDYTIEETKNEILKTPSYIAVYIAGDIAPRRYITNTIYDYSNCNDNFEPIEREPINIRISEEDDDMYDCPRVVRTTRTIDACFVSKDPNYNPYED